MGTYTIAVCLRFGGEVGMGHLKRMLSLATALRDHGFSPLFITQRLAAVDEEIIVTRGYGEVTLQYSAEQSASLAHLVVAEMRKHESVRTLIIDDYQAGENFEQEIVNAGYKVVAIDDLRRRHRADLLVDAKWRGQDKTPVAYRGLVPASCRCLLGPKYYLFERDYCDLSAKVKKLDARRRGESFSILLSLGGMPNLGILKLVVDELKEKLSAHFDVEIRPVVGSQKEGRSSFLNYCRDHSINPVVDASSLRDYYRTSDLFVGAAGGSIYEAMLCGIPAVTFIVADNQQQDVAIFKEIGHSHHFNQHFNDCKDALMQSIMDIYSDYDRAVSQLEVYRQFYDCMGAERVAKCIHEFEQGKYE